MRPDIFLATIGRGSNGSNALEVTEDRAAVTAESQDNIINRVNNVSQYGPSWHYVPGIGVAGTAYAEVPDRSLGDLAFTRASSKTRTNAAGLIQTIGNNVPPHDYRNADGSLSTFPRLNLEPQRTNLLLRSEEFDNAAWGKFTTTVVANAEISPDGTQDAETMTVSTSDSRVEQTTTLTAGTYIFSVYVKVISQTTAGTMRLQSFVDGANVNFTFTPTTQWQRVTATYTAASSLTSVKVRGQAFVGTLAIWGAQLEAGAYATTYIPTTTAAVTRIADVASKTGVSSIIGQSAGTIFWDVNDLTGTPTSTGNPDFAIRNTAFTNWIGITTAAFATPFRVDVRATSGTLFSYTANITRAKAAVAWSSAGAVLYVNGAQVATSAVNPNFSFDRIDMLGGIISYKTNQAALFKTRLTNAQLAQLTTL